MGQHMSAMMKTEFIDTMTHNPVKIVVKEVSPPDNKEVSPPDIF
jgi:hypothetical protein